MDQKKNKLIFLVRPIILHHIKYIFKKIMQLDDTTVI